MLAAKYRPFAVLKQFTMLFNHMIMDTEQLEVRNCVRRPEGDNEHLKVEPCESKLQCFPYFLIIDDILPQSLLFRET